jgi:hypothetical protein
MKLFHYLLLCSLFTISKKIFCVTTLYASALQTATTLSVNDPTGTLVILDVNLTISPAYPLTLTGNAGNLTFTAAENQQLIIAQNTAWNISSLLKPHALTFTQSAKLVMMPGAQLLADQVTGVNLNFQDETVMSVQL